MTGVDIIFCCVYTGNTSVSKNDQLSSSMIIAIAVPGVVLLLLMILVVTVSILLFRRCRSYKQHDMEKYDYNGKRYTSLIIGDYVCCNVKLQMNTCIINYVLTVAQSTI